MREGQMTYDLRDRLQQVQEREAGGKTLEFIQTNFPKEFKKIRFGAEQPATVGLGIKPVSRPGSEPMFSMRVTGTWGSSMNSISTRLGDAADAPTQNLDPVWRPLLVVQPVADVQVDAHPRVAEGVNERPQFRR